MDAELWAEIRRLHLREHLSQREIARRLAIAPKTVRRALRQEHFEPTKRPPRASALDPFKDALRAILARHPALSAVRLHAEARALGYAGSLTVLKDFVRSIRHSSPPEAFLRLSFPPGDAAQVDWTACGFLLVEGKPRRHFFAASAGRPRGQSSGAEPRSRSSMAMSAPIPPQMPTTTTIRNPSGSPWIAAAVAA